MTTLNFRLAATRSDLPQRAQRRLANPTRGPLGAPTAAALPSVRKMDAEVAALIALRRLGMRELQLQALDSDLAADPVGASGWFDSTWELANGLDIAEGMPADLPLDGWLQIYLAA